jgi:hypothetical protein
MKLITLFCPKIIIIKKIVKLIFLLCLNLHIIHCSDNPFRTEILFIYKEKEVLNPNKIDNNFGIVYIRINKFN